MGLFKNKKAAMERAIMENVHDIVCLHCFQRFAHDRVLFRALEILGAEGYYGQYDQVLDQYRERFHLGTAGELPVVLDPAHFHEENKGYHRGVLTSLRDDYDNTTTKRICPHCHNSIHQSAGFAPSTIISVVGATQAGKSVFLTSLIHTLKTVTPHKYPVFCTPIHNEMGRKFKLAYYDPLVEEGLLLPPTQKERQQEPFIFTFSFADGRKPEINIAFFDVAGEGIVDTSYMDMYAAHIRNASGILFLVDPLQFRSIGRKIKLLNHLPVDTHYSEEPTEVLSGLVEDYIYKEAGGASTIPTAIVLTKTDLLEPLRESGEYAGDPGAFISQVDPNFSHALQRRFITLDFFAVSALGSNPDDGRVASFAPLGVDAPFLWLLRSLGYLEDDGEN